MHRADTTHVPIRGFGDTQRKVEEDARSDDIDSKPRRPKKPQGLSWKVKQVAAKKGQQRASEPLRTAHVERTNHRSSFSDLEPVSMGELQERPLSLPVTTAQVIHPFTESYRGSYAASANDSLSSEAGQIELLRVRSLILEAGYDFPDLRGRPGETAEDAVMRLLEHYRKLNISLEDSHMRLAGLNSMEDELNATKNRLMNCQKDMFYTNKKFSDTGETLKTLKAKHEDDMRKAKHTIKDLEQEIARGAEEVARLNEEQRAFASDKAAFVNQKREFDAIQSQVTSLKVQNRELVSAHSAKLKNEIAERNDLKVNYEKQLKDLRDETITKTRNERSVHNKAIEDLQKLFKDERAKWTTHMSTLKADLERRIKDGDLQTKKQLREQEDQHAKAMQLEQTKFEKTKGEFREHLRQQQAQLHEAEKSQEERRADEQRRLEKELRRQEESLKGQYEHEHYKLRSAIEDLKSALVTKEHFKGLTDLELTSRFTKLAQEVEDFARLEWEPAREAVWWTQQLQQLHPRNTRKLKQALVQNSVWISLRELVFSSPFKLFAEGEGWAELDKDWIDIYAMKTSPSEWPKISRDIEKSRYENAKQLRAAIDPSVKVGTQDRLGQLKMTYEKLVALTVNAIARNIEKVATFQEKDRKALQKIVRLSAELWLECCSQRYRLIVTLAGGIEDVLGISQGNIRLAKLVLKPELRRFGNSHGDQLANEELIAGWRSAVDIYPPQRAVSA